MCPHALICLIHLPYFQSRKVIKKIWTCLTAHRFRPKNIIDFSPIQKKLTVFSVQYATANTEALKRHVCCVWFGFQQVLKDRDLPSDSHPRKHIYQKYLCVRSVWEFPEYTEQLRFSASVKQKNPLEIGRQIDRYNRHIEICTPSAHLNYYWIISGLYLVCFNLVCQKSKIYFIFFM